jgi:platelet-activating factor acetylhydrolase
MVFSHGIGGSKNTYSYLLGSLASHGMVVFAPEHRDGSGPISMIRSPENSNKNGRRHTVAASVEYEHIEHVMGPEVLRKRHKQIRTRCWELGLLYDALLGLDKGEKKIAAKENSDFNPCFTSSLDIHRPGCISWAGHSFGAATMVQFVKSVFWQVSENPGGDHSSESYFQDYELPYKPLMRTELIQQITPKSPMILLDLWTLPLRGEKVRWLWEKPLPCYLAEEEKQEQAPSFNVLAILSSAFFNWETNLKATKHILSHHHSTGTNPEPDKDNKKAKAIIRTPRLFYPLKSAHLSQSDIGVLFPWVMKRWLRAEESERIMELNMRAILQMLRGNGVGVAASTAGGEEVDSEGDGNDGRIFDRELPVRGWVEVDIEGDKSEQEVQSKL